MKQKKPQPRLSDLSPEELDQAAARGLRAAADDLREASNALKRAGDFGPEIDAKLKGVRDTAVRVKKDAGKKLK